MAELGGYFAVSYLSERVFADALEALWRTEQEKATGTGHWSAETPFGHLEMSGGVSLDKPGMAFRGERNAIEVHLTGAMRVDVRLAGDAVGGVFIRVDSLASLRVNVSHERGFRKAVVDLTGFTIDAAQIGMTWFDGPHHTNAAPALLSAASREAISEEVRRLAGNFLTFRLPTDELFLAELAVMTKGVPGSLVITPEIQLGNVRILDSWMALGIDDASIGGTRGNAVAIGPPPELPPPAPAPMPQAEPGPGTLRLIVDPRLAVNYLQQNAKFAVIMASATQPSLHPNADSVRVSLEDDVIVVNASGTVDEPDPFSGQIPFTANVRVRPFIPESKRGGTVYASVKPNVRVDTSWYLDVFGAIIDFFGGDVFEKLRRVNSSQMAVLFPVVIRETRVPETFGVYASLQGRHLVTRPDLFGIYGELKIRTTFSEPDLTPTPTVRSYVRIRDRYLKLQFAGRMSVDPTFQVRYHVRRGSNSVEVASGTASSGTSEPFGDAIDLWDPGNVRETSYTVELIAERPPGTIVSRNVQNVAVLDPFDRSHPFVRWRKQHYYTGGGPIPIQSAIHRTGFPGRCKFCDVRESRFGTPYVYQPLDTLPAPEEEGFSTRLCKYCFPDA